LFKEDSRKYIVEGHRLSVGYPYSQVLARKDIKKLLQFSGIFPCSAFFENFMKSRPKILHKLGGMIPSR